jgi:hypothetical protein
MEKLHLVSTGLLALLLISCDQGLTEESSYSSSPAAVSTSATEAVNSIPAAATAAPATASVPEPAKVAAFVPVINPPHGQQGHRCDVAVGALITSAAPNTASNPVPNTASNATKSFSTISLPPVLAPNLAAFANAATASNQNLPAAPSLFPMKSSVPIPSTVTQPTFLSNALNPAHGKPGHRCDIPVGAPLNSGARTTAALPTATATAPTFSTAVPIAAPAISIPASVAVAPGMNPSHGQPGHRCDIPVGSPLNSKP